MKSWHNLSSAAVVTPATTCGVIMSKTLAASLPALRIPANPSSPCRMTVSCRIHHPVIFGYDWLWITPTAPYLT
jgi:hypothetical protein